MFTTNSSSTLTNAYHRSENASDDDAIPPVPPMSAYSAKQLGNAASTQPNSDAGTLYADTGSDARTDSITGRMTCGHTYFHHQPRQRWIYHSSFYHSFHRIPTASDVLTRSRATSQYMPAHNESNAMSPDAMLAAYKKKRSKKGSLSGATATTSVNGGMRVCMFLCHNNEWRGGRV
ncbi:hypothetical protein FRC02_010270 [Tulasnella sp. 418]|nr:hypothetical protein FRC02_010270 [Tulasnella sp. 418]